MHDLGTGEAAGLAGHSSWDDNLVEGPDRWAQQALGMQKRYVVDVGLSGTATLHALHR